MYWIAVACREHVKRGIAGNFCQVCHGKLGPLKKMTADDWIVYYSPTITFEEKAPCQKFTAIGRVSPNQPYQCQMSIDFIPWRRDVAFLPAKEVSIRPLIDQLSFIPNKDRWGFPFRKGIFSIPPCDFRLIAQSMKVEVAEEACHE